MDAAYHQLLEWMRAEGPRLLVALSGGVDSSLLAAAATDALGSGVLCVTARSALHPQEEQEQASSLAKQLGCAHRFIDAGEFEQDEVRANGPDRCYHCKRHIGQTLKALALKENLGQVIEGSNADDDPARRPGARAVSELGLRSPLAELGLGKTQVRALARARGLPNWDRPASACLATRIPSGETLEKNRLKRIEQAEAAMRSLFLGREGAMRVRDHGSLARLELEPKEFEMICTDPLLRECVRDALIEIGYAQACLDLNGFRSGSMDVAKKKQEEEDA